MSNLKRYASSKLLFLGSETPYVNFV